MSTSGSLQIDDSDDNPGGNPLAGSQSGSKREDWASYRHPTFNLQVRREQECKKG
jgi:hypothetical protein